MGVTKTDTEYQFEHFMERNNYRTEAGMEIIEDD
jgi:hypothetical protein